MKHLRQILGGVFFLSLPLLFSSCEDILGEWDRPTPAQVPVSPTKVYLYGGPDKPEQTPFVPGAWDTAAMRFNSTDGTHLPTIPDEVYFGLKTLIFDVSDVSADFDMKVMNAWWSSTYYDHVTWADGLNELKITKEMAEECAPGGEARDLTLMLYGGSCTVKAVYYEE